MRNVSTHLVILALLVGSTQTATAAPILKKGISCLVSAKDDVQIPANQSGVLVEMVAKRGMQVDAPQKNEEGKLVGALMARIDAKKEKAAALAAAGISEESQPAESSGDVPESGDAADSSADAPAAADAAESSGFCWL